MAEPYIVPKSLGSKLIQVYETQTNKCFNKWYE